MLHVLLLKIGLWLLSVLLLSLGFRVGLETGTFLLPPFSRLSDIAETGVGLFTENAS